MKVSGTATIGHSVGDVYAALTDPAVLVRTLPGCQRLELVGPDRYSATLAAGVGSIKGLFDVDVRLADQAAPDSFTLHASGAGGPGTVSVVAQVRLAPDAVGGTVVHYSADATVGGMIGGVGQRMLTGVARRTATDFFAAVDRALTDRPASGAVGGDGSSASAGAVAGGGAVVGGGAVAGGGAAGADAAARECAVAREGAVTGDGAAMVPALAPVAAPTGPTVWTRPQNDSGGRRLQDLILAASFGAGIALLGVLIGAFVARW